MASSSIVEIFLECSSAIRRGELIRRSNRDDKEFAFQNWFQARLDALGLKYDPPGRNAYPDFRLVGLPEGYEVKGLAYPGREASYDANSQVPTGVHNGRDIYYIFGRYPSKVDGNEYPVIDLVLFHGDFLNADHDYVHQNKHISGFGSYGDIMIRDRKMYVAPTPFAITKGTAGLQTLILPAHVEVDYSKLEICGELSRFEAEFTVIGYDANLVDNTLIEQRKKNPTAGNPHQFRAYRIKGSNGPTVDMV